MIGRKETEDSQKISSETIALSSHDQKLRKIVDPTTKQWFVLLLLAVAAIASSVLVIFSCKFFSYQNDATEVVGNKEDEVVDQRSSEPVISFNPFEFFSAAGVGLFRYYMGDPTGKGVMINDAICFSYCDEYTDYQWLSSNNNGNEEIAHGNVDVWLVARYCSILAPSFGLLASLIHIQLLLSKTMRGSVLLLFNCNNTNNRTYRGGRLLEAFLFLMAAVLQFGTFSVMFASPIMYSTSSEDQQQRFCFSATSKVRCRIDTGAIFSLGSAVVYLLLAVLMFSVSLDRPVCSTSSDSMGCWSCCSSFATTTENQQSNTDCDSEEEEKNTSDESGGGSDDGKICSEIHRTDSHVSCESC
mmetsp:Transcript_4914/g.10868  ORF Transcript_4914/g.10868 Transcript_4914/m.10868 type:complete len:357 (+) Transcript_4914:172-1242(+)